MTTPPVPLYSQKPVANTFTDFGYAGQWLITVRAPGLAPVDITTVRGIPTTLGSFAFDDPFDESTFTITIPKITVFDQRGAGELAWCVHDADIDLVWDGEIPAGYPVSSFKWEGSIASFDPSTTGLNVSCVGAMRQVDNYLAKPEYPSQPIPYEWAIARQFAGRPDLRVSTLKMEWPTWWKTKYTTPAKGTPLYLIPTGVKAGDNWSGLVTRATGSWDAALTSYINGMLSSMYTARGRFTLANDPGRIPVLRHLDYRTEADDNDIVISALDPDVTIALSEDWSQSANVAYGQGKSLAGVAFSGMDVTADGSATTYSPLASLRQVEPPTDKNGWFQRGRFRREVSLQLQDGIDEEDARKVAVAHIQRFSEPGYTGTVTIGTDPTINGVRMARFLVRAGMTIRIPGLFGNPAGLVMHVTQSSHDFGSEQTTLTVDTKYRDALTVQEVMQRGRDALRVTRMLVAGSYQPPIPDQMLPWDYSSGSGFIPGGPQLSSLRLFKGMPADIHFPWTEWTQKHPPKAAAWKSCYIKIGPASHDARNNWSVIPDVGGIMHGIPIKMSQAGQIRMIQIAAYDESGNVLPVSFHASLYYAKDVNVTSMPKLPLIYAPRYPPYAAGEEYPFFPGAWEKYNDDGTLISPEENTSSVDTAGLIQAWGSNYEKAGYYPGSNAAGNPATGMLVDESGFSFDCTHFDANWNPYTTAANAVNALAGQVYLMIYCDAQRSVPVYFAGRMFLEPPGSST